ncbi:MAG: J domain-containing protein [Alkalispirochaeta sp.]
MWDRLESLVRSWVTAYRHDPEYTEEAWQELEDYLKGETGRSHREAEGPRESLSPEMKQAFYDLELPPGADSASVKRAYRRLLLKYHPDRFHGDRDRAATAEEVTRRISLAYKRLNDYYRY